MPIHITPSTDTLALSAVATATFLDTYAHMIPWSSIRAHNAAHNSAHGIQMAIDAGARCWLARMDGTDAPVALAMMTAPDLPVATTSADTELKRIYALECAKGRGVGARLLDAVEEAAREAGKTRLLLGVYAHNPTISWYKRRGFSQVGTRRFTVGADTFDDLVLAKAL